MIITITGNYWLQNLGGKLIGVQFLLLSFSFWGFACKYVRALCPLGAHEGLKMTSGPLELGLWVVVSHHVDAGTIKPVSFTNPRSHCFQLLTHLSASI